MGFQFSVLLLQFCALLLLCNFACCTSAQPYPFVRFVVNEENHITQAVLHVLRWSKSYRWPSCDSGVDLVLAHKVFFFEDFFVALSLSKGPNDLFENPLRCMFATVIVWIHSGFQSVFSLKVIFSITACHGLERPARPRPKITAVTKK